MGKTILRNLIADFLNTGAPDTGIWSLMGAGFNTLDENPGAQIDTKAYINDRSATSVIKGYRLKFPFDTDLVESEAAVSKLYDMGRNQAQGGDAEAEYVRVELFRDCEGAGENVHPARKFRVAVEVNSISGGGAEVIHVSGSLNNVGSYTDGMFDISSKTFIAL